MDMELDMPCSPAADPGMMTGMMSGAPGMSTPTYGLPNSPSITGTDRKIPKMPTHQKRYASGSVKPNSNKRK